MRKMLTALAIGEAQVCSVKILSLEALTDKFEEIFTEQVQTTFVSNSYNCQI